MFPRYFILNRAVLVCSGYNKTPRNGWCKQQEFVSHSFLQAGKSKIQVPPDWVPSKGPLPGWFSSVHFSCSVASNSLRPHGLQHARPSCPSPTPGAYSNSCSLSWWFHLTISSSVIPCSSHPQSFPASGTFLMRQFFASGGQSIGASASASVLPGNIQVWFPLGWTGWISLQSKGLSRVFSNTTVQKHWFFSAQLSLQSSSHYHPWCHTSCCELT